MTTWNEADHPRDDEGKFTYKGGSGSSSKGSNNDKTQSREDILYPTMRNIQDQKVLLSKAIDTETSNSQNAELQLDWIMPVDSGYISSPYGNRKSPGPGASTFHSGIDIAVPVGTPVKAIADGKIRVATGGDRKSVV